MKRIGVVHVPDNANDRDFHRWLPRGATLLATRTTLDPEWLRPVDPLAEPEVWIPTDDELRDAVRTLILVEPEVITYACTSGSFGGPPDNEERIRRVMTDAGAKVAQTTSGSVLDALNALEVGSVAVGTPYDEVTTRALKTFLEHHAYEVVSLVNHDPGPEGSELDLTYEDIRALALKSDRSNAEAVFLSCTALETFDMIPDLESDLGKPVVTAAQTTIWAALGAAGLPCVDTPQTLTSKPWAAHPKRST